MSARSRQVADPQQMLLDWTGASSAPAGTPVPEPILLSAEAVAIIHGHLPPPNVERYITAGKKSDADSGEVVPQPGEDTTALPTGSGLVQVLPWDFRHTFPEPLEEAVEAGKLQEDDVEPENLKALHEEHTQHALATLHDLDAVMDAKRLGVDPRTGKALRTAKQRERLDALFRDEPGRLEHTFNVLMDVYEEAFGTEARGAFEKALRAWHAGVEVITEAPPMLAPVEESIACASFGREEDGSAVDPSAQEIREITEQLADELAELPDGPQRQALLAKYAEDFGDHAARELLRWSELKAKVDDGESLSYDPGHPWHYYAEGDAAEPIRAASIPARNVSLEHFGVKWPKNEAKRRALMERMLADQRARLQEDEHRYQELIDSGIAALSQYDREIAHGGDDDLAWASAVALKYNHISGGRGRILCLEKALTP